MDDYYVDLLVGWHFYKKGSTIIESSFNSINNIAARTILLWNEYIQNDPKAEGILTDRPKNNKPGKLTLVLNSQQNQFTWKLENTEGLHYSKSSDPSFDYGFTLPKNLVFTKQ
jgi:hypothetical protein